MAAPKICQIIDHDNHVELISPHFSYVLATEAGLRAERLTNRICGKTMEMAGGMEFRADFDSADARIPIDGWKVFTGTAGCTDPDAEYGFQNGFHQVDCYDANWDGYQSPVMFEEFKFEPDRFKWARTHVFLPEAHRGRKLAIIVGGFGVMDFRYLRAFLNGVEIGTRITGKRWHEPGCFEIDLSSALYPFLRFGQDNVLVLQLTGYLCRSEKLDAHDPLQGRELATIGRSWPGQFEQYITVGQPLETPGWAVTGKAILEEGDTGRIDFSLLSDCGGYSAVASYRWDGIQPVLRKFLEIRNHTGHAVRLMNVSLGEYRTNLEPTEGEQGFPVYLGGSFFLAVAHPSGWAMGQDHTVSLRQYPGRLLQDGDSFSSMETVLGVSEDGSAREGFLAHIHSRMRRVKRGHDKAISIFESFGSWPIRPMELDYGHFPDETAILHNIGAVAQGQTEDGCHFDYYSIEFWNDYNGDFTRPGTMRFPNGLHQIRENLADLGTGLGLWIDTSAGRWSIGGNPVIKSCRTYPAATYETKTQNVVLGECYCRAADPFKAMLTNGFLHHIRENKARLLKFDDAMAVCHNPNHSHLPGIYSTEAIQSAEIDMLDAFDKACPELFMILYWGHRSPWWLLHADTLFESGLFLEASTPASFPTLYARDGVTVTLDQAAYWCDDVPKLGKDSLGVWLTDWAWNSSIHTERWCEGIVMDLCRGSLLFQVWSDQDWLSPEERKQAALFMELLKRGEDCFRNSRPILGNPWNYEPYGYCCTNGKRGFIALNNCTWSDVTVQLELNERWGFEPGMGWDLYRLYPGMAMLDGGEGPAGSAAIALRPFDVVLLEAVPHGQPATLPYDYAAAPLVQCFTTPTRRLELTVLPTDGSSAPETAIDRLLNGGPGLTGTGAAAYTEWQDAPPRILETVSLSDYASYVKKTAMVSAALPLPNAQGTMFIAATMQKDGLLAKLTNLGMHFAAKAEFCGKEINCEPVIGPLTYAIPWQGWRIEVPQSEGGQVQLTVSAMVPDTTEISFTGYFIPHAGC